MPASIGLLKFITPENTGALFKNEYFALGLLKFLDAIATRIIFDLILRDIHVSNYREIANIKESLAYLMEARLVSISNSMLSLSADFRESLISGFCLPSIDRIFIEQQCVENFLEINLDFNKMDMKMQTSRNKNTRNNSIHLRLAENKLSLFKKAIIDKNISSLFLSREIQTFKNYIDIFGEITNKGFEFLLKGASEQLWDLIIGGIELLVQNRKIKITREQAKGDENCSLDGILAALMEISLKSSNGIFKIASWSPIYSFLDTIGVICLLNTNDIEEIERNVAYNRLYLEENGMIVKSLDEAHGAEINGGTNLNSAELYEEAEANSSYLYAVVNSSLLFGDNSNSDKFIYIETNYKIYAYTNEAYEISILGLFTECVYSLPNMIKADLTEESVCKAFSRGISASQIIQYLEEKAVEVPGAIASQIAIWENKQQRIKMTNGILYSDFMHLKDYLLVLRFLESKNQVYYKDENKRVIIGGEKYENEVSKMLAKL
ncbi:transcription initiation factor TFIIH subunit 4 [Enteropsectra breve]|nr:transcription initiation factor TFIIH subunit 4 [Enteropsectra breve]